MYLFFSFTVNKLKRMFACSVFGCNNEILTSNSPVQLHKFPKDPDIIQKWLDACTWKVGENDIETGIVISKIQRGSNL